MSRDLTLLDEDFQVDFGNVLRRCQEKGVIMRPFSTLRNPWTQARLWRQSRPIERIELVEAQLREDGADYLADVLVSVGPLNGPKVTNAIPGNSWHQYGLAVDCFWFIRGDAEWHPQVLVAGINGYHIYSDVCLDLGIRTGSVWGDWPHCQKPKESAPEKIMTWLEINEQMLEKFGRTEELP